MPPGARYFSCTVEAMPLDRPAEFLAVDEIQLCADPDRGHVFTDRLLHARGLVETMFLGAETIRRLLKRLIPDAEIETRPRLSELSLRRPGQTGPAAAPLRHRRLLGGGGLRHRRGGAAPARRLRGGDGPALAPHPQRPGGAVPGQGGGLPGGDRRHRHGPEHGCRPRRLRPPLEVRRPPAPPVAGTEVAQIAGRAGRGMRDGTFGVTADCPPFTDELVTAVETHAFEPLEQLCWRNASWISPRSSSCCSASPPHRHVPA